MRTPSLLGLALALAADASVVTGDLRSETQPAPVVFRKGRARTVAGSSVLREATLRLRDGDGRTWEAEASHRGEGAPRVEVAAGRPNRLEIGAPLRLACATAWNAKTRALTVEMRIVGRGGEAYRWPHQNPAKVPPGFQIRDAEGKVLHAASFEYG
jgi:hypothetical protein